MLAALACITTTFMKSKNVLPAFIIRFQAPRWRYINIVVSLLILIVSITQPLYCEIISSLSIRKTDSTFSPLQNKESIVRVFQGINSRLWINIRHRVWIWDNCVKPSHLSRRHSPMPHAITQPTTSANVVFDRSDFFLSATLTNSIDRL